MLFICRIKPESDESMCRQVNCSKC